MRKIFSKADGHKRRGEPAQKGELSRAPASGFPQGLFRLRSELDHLFDRFFSTSWRDWSGRSFHMAAWAPSVELINSEKEFLVRAEMPGLDLKEIEVAVSGNSLVLSGEKKEEREDKGKSYVRSERRFGVFRRTIALPAGVDVDQISAQYDRGVLSIRVPKSESLKPKRIEVKSPSGSGPQVS